MTQKKKTTSEIIGIQPTPEVLKTIEYILSTTAPQFKFGSFDLDDVKQEGRFAAIKALKKFDNKRPLENFLRVAIRNALINFKRNNTRRNDPPCIRCPHYDPLFKKSENQCLVYLNKSECEPYFNFCEKTTKKTNVLQPIDLDEVSDDEPGIYKYTELEDEADHKDLLRKIDKELPVEMRLDYLRLRQGANVPKAQRDLLQAKLREILGVDDGEE